MAVSYTIVLPITNPKLNTALQVRLVPQRPGIAFCEYDSDVQSTVALQGLQGFKLATDKPMKITYARQ